MRFIRSLKLEDFCLQVIVENLEKYIYNRNLPPKHIDFLLRAYSEDVFRTFIHKHQVTEESMLWFLNPHCKSITLHILSEKITKQLQVIGPQITSLNLYETLATENMINSIVCCIPEVKYLDLSSSLCSDRTLLCVRKMCPLLITLNLYDCDHVTCDGMMNLCGGNLKIKNLNLIGTEVEYGGLHDILKGMPSLQCIKFDDMAEALYYIHEHDLKRANVNIFYNLTELIYNSIDMFNPIDVLHGWTVMCPNVTKVHITFTSTKKMYEMCSRFQHLTDLKIKFDESNFFYGIGDPVYMSEEESEYDEDMSMEDLADPMYLKYMHCKDILSPFMVRANTLTSLNLSRVKINTELLMQCFKNLQVLCLKSVSFEQFEEIKLEDNGLIDVTIKDISLDIPANYRAVSFLLSVCKNVNKLALNRIKNMPLGVFDVILYSMKHLSFVDFSFTSLNFPYLLRFFKIPSMKVIYADACCKISQIESDELKERVIFSNDCSFSWRYWNDTDDSYEDSFEDNVLDD